MAPRRRNTGKSADSDKRTDHSDSRGRHAKKNRTATRLYRWVAIVLVLGVGFVVFVRFWTKQTATIDTISRTVWANHEAADLESYRRNITETLHELYDDNPMYGPGVVRDTKWSMPPLKIFNPDMAVFKVSSEPLVFYVQKLLSDEEASLAVKAFNDPSIRNHWRQNSKGDKVAPNALLASKLPPANELDKVLNKRIAALTGMPETHVEMGYMTEKSPGFEFGQIHHDQGNQRANNKYPTVQSMVIFLSESPTALTTFPLAKPLVGIDAAWEDFVVSQAIPELKRSGFRHLTTEDNRDIAKRVLQRHVELCSHPQRLVPQPGDAVWFFNYLNDTEDLRSIHGTCSTPVGSKLTLSKFIQAGPDGFMR